MKSVGIHPEMTMREWYTLMGKYYGYPDCCIESFILTPLIMCTMETQIKASNGSMYVPCMACATKVVKKEITLASLIKNRKCPFVFPDDRRPDEKDHNRALNWVNEEFEKTIFKNGKRS